MKNGKEFVGRIIAAAEGGIKPSIAKVVSYANGMAQLSLLPDNDILIDVPGAITQGGGYYISVPLKKGDLVCVMFTSTDLNDSVIVGLIGSEAAPDLPEGGGLAVGRPGGACLIIKEDNSIEINAPGGVNIVGKSTSGSW